MQDSVTYRFLDINKMTTESIPNYSPADYINQKEYSGSLDKPILHVCEEMYAEMNVTFYDRLFVFKNTKYVLRGQTPRTQNITSGDIVYIYVIFMTSAKKNAFTNTIFNSMVTELGRVDCEWTYSFKWQEPTVQGWEYAVASEEGQRRAHMCEAQRRVQDWNGVF